MTDRLLHIEAIFPDLAAAGYSPRSEKSGVYNCIAYAAGDDTRPRAVTRGPFGFGHQGVRILWRRITCANR